MKIGDKVRFLSSVGGGIVARINGNMAYVVDEDGFETPSLVKELVVVGEGTIPSFKPNDKTDKAEAKTKEIVFAEPEPEYVPEEVEGGDKINVLLAYEPVDIQRLSTTTFDTYLVNDSNYYLNFTYLTRDDDSAMWTCRHINTVEPNTQLFLGELLREDISKIGHVTLQMIAYKKGKDFEVKPAINVELRIDVTKFFKLHCFTDNMYFDNRVLAFDIVKGDVARGESDDLKVKKEELRAASQDAYQMSDDTRFKSAMREKRLGERQTRKVKQKPAEKRGEIIVVDLHIQELVDNTRGLSNADMLNLQVDRFRQIMDENINNHGQKIIFIHGKGEGVLRNALLKELNYRYKGHDVQDASFREYGFGATQVKIK